MSHEETRARRRAFGVCYNCGNPKVVKGQQRCAECIEKLKIVASISYSERRRQGVCSQCGNDAVPGKVRCAQCLEKDRLRHSRLRAVSKMLNKKG